MFPAWVYQRQLEIACQARRSVGVLDCVLKPLGERPPADSGTVRIPIGMYNRKLLQGRGTYTVHTDVVHMGRFGSVRTLRGVWTCHACYGCRGGKVSSRI